MNEPLARAEAILFAALDHADEDREAFLFTACGDDASLLAEVRALLAVREDGRLALDLSDTKVIDLSPLAHCEDLQILTLPPNAKDIEFLRTIPKLQRISFNVDPKTFEPDKTAEEFWKEYDARRK